MPQYFNSFFKKLTFHHRVLAAIPLATVLTAGWMVVSSYYSLLSQSERENLLRLQGIVNTAALHIDTERYMRLMEKFPQKDDILKTGQNEDYDFLHTQLKNVQQLNMLATPVYILTLNAAGDFEFGATSAPVPYWKHIYSSSPEVLKQNYRRGGTVPAYSDEYGMWLSAFAPLKNAEGVTIGVVQADYRADEFLMQSRSQMWGRLASVFFVSVFMGLLLVFYVRRQLVLDRRHRIQLETYGNTITAINAELEAGLQALEKADRLRREMVANISHDLRTPLAVIRGFTDTLRENFGRMEEAEQRKFLNTISTETTRLTKLVADLFEYSKLEAKAIVPVPERVNVTELLYDALQKFTPLVEQKQLKLYNEIGHENLFVPADAEMINRVINNLLDNAIKYAEPGGFVKIKASALVGGYVRMAVCNSGQEISEADRELIFERYYKSYPSSAHATGLGLAIVKKIVELHKGEIFVESPAPGVVTFVVHLPGYDFKATL